MTNQFSFSFCLLLHFVNGALFVACSCCCYCTMHFCLHRSFLASHAHFANGQLRTTNSLLSSIERKQRLLLINSFVSFLFRRTLSLEYKKCIRHCQAKPLERTNSVPNEIEVQEKKCRNGIISQYSARILELQCEIAFITRDFYLSKVIAFLNGKRIISTNTPKLLKNQQHTALCV